MSPITARCICVIACLWVSAAVAQIGPGDGQRPTPAIGPSPPTGPGTVAAIGPTATYEQTCTQGATFIARTSGFSVEQEKQYDAAICALVASGTFAKLDALYILAAPNQAASLLNLVSTSYSLTLNGTMTFGANAGWMGDGATGYLATGFTPSTAGGNYAAASRSLGFGLSDPRQTYINAFINLGSTSDDFTVFDDIIVLDSSGTENLFSLEGFVQNINAPPTVANGGWIISATQAGGSSAYYNGSLLTPTSSSGSYVAELPNHPFLVGAFNFPAGGCGPCSWTGDTVTWAFFGAALTQADVTALTKALATWPTTTAPVPAIAQGFFDNIFNYSFAAQGLTGIDVNATLQPGFTWYTAWWLGARAAGFNNQIAPPASVFAYSGNVVTVGNSSQGALLTTRGNTGSAFTATILGTTMTVTGVLYGPLLVGQVIVGSSALSGQTIVSQLTGPGGGIGTYQLSASATIAVATNLQGNSSVAGTAPLFTAGGYYECAISYGSATSGFPSCWMMDLQGFYSYNLNAGFGAFAHWAEFDIFEAPSASDANAIDWNNTNGGGAGSNNRVNQAYATITNPTALHYYGMLWVPSAQNGGVGLIQFYFDRVHATLFGMNDITYSLSGAPTPACTPSNLTACLFVSEIDNFVLAVQSGNAGYPVNLTSWNVWH